MTNWLNIDKKQKGSSTRAEEQNTLLAFLIEHSQDFHTHNGWLQEPKRSSPDKCPAWLIIPSVVKGRSALPGSSHLVRELGGYLKAALTSRGYFYCGSHSCMQAHTIENLMTEK